VAAAGYAAPDAAEDLSTLSATELVERLEHEQQSLHRLEAARESGAQALLQAARAQRPAAVAPDDEAAPTVLLLELQRLSRELDRRARHLAEREAAHAERAAALLEMQDRVAGHAQTIVAHLCTDAAGQARPRRAMAS
jgi:hypothetical protein